MAELIHGDTRINYEVSGQGPPLLALAPGGLSASRIEVWGRAPWNPLEVLADKFTVVAMDQRNTGTSWGPIGPDGWSDYCTDHLALMDHLGFDRFSVIGMCIGGAFVAKLMMVAPERLECAVALQPIGRDSNEKIFSEFFDDWQQGIAEDHPEAGPEDWAAMKDGMFGNETSLWSVSDQQLSESSTPLLVCSGNDQYHPASASRVMADRVPGAIFIEKWKEGDDLDPAKSEVREFLVTRSG